VKHAFSRRQIRSDQHSRHYYSLTHYAQTAHNGAMAVPTEHQVVLDFIRQKYRSQNQSRVPSPRCRDSGPHFSPKRTLRARSHRQPPIPMPARFARTRAPRVSWWTVYYCNTTPITCSTAATMPVTRPETHPLRVPHTRRALRDSAEGASGVRGTSASDSSGFPLKPVPPWWPSRSGVTMFALYKGVPSLTLIYWFWRF